MLVDGLPGGRGVVKSLPIALPSRTCYMMRPLVATALSSVGGITRYIQKAYIDFGAGFSSCISGMFSNTSLCQGREGGGCIAVSVALRSGTCYAMRLLVAHCVDLISYN